MPEALFSMTKLKTLYCLSPITFLLPRTHSKPYHRNPRNFDLTKFNGTIPSTIGNLADLQYFGIGTTDVSGPIPSGITMLTKLTYLFVDFFRVRVEAEGQGLGLGLGRLS